MIRYFVVQTLSDLEGDIDVQLVPCEDTRSIARAIADARDAEGGDWHLFEMVGNRPVSRAVTFKMDGRLLYDVVITS